MSTLLEIALSQYGQKEIEGKEDNKTILQFAAEAGHTWVNNDETHWCSIFLDWCAMKANMERSRSARAKDWANVGEEVLTPKTGDIVVWEHHVGIWCSLEFGRNQKPTGLIYVLGGNQNNQVKISLFKTGNVLCYRRLREIKN